MPQGTMMLALVLFACGGTSAEREAESTPVSSGDDLATDASGSGVECVAERINDAWAAPEGLGEIAEAFAARPDVVAIFDIEGVNERRGPANAAANAMHAETDVDVGFATIDARGRVIARDRDLNRMHGSPVDVAAAALSGEKLSFEMLWTSLFDGVVVGAIAPIRQGDTIVGAALVFAPLADLAEWKQQVGHDLILIQEDEVQSTLPRQDSRRVGAEVSNALGTQEGPVIIELTTGPAVAARHGEIIWAVLGTACSSD